MRQLATSASNPDLVEPSWIARLGPLNMCRSASICPEDKVYSKSPACVFIGLKLWISRLRGKITEEDGNNASLVSAYERPIRIFTERKPSRDYRWFSCPWCEVGFTSAATLGWHYGYCDDYRPNKASSTQEKKGDNCGQKA